jgi:hypothetical protein
MVGVTVLFASSSCALTQPIMVMPRKRVLLRHSEGTPVDGNGGYRTFHQPDLGLELTAHSGPWR